MATESVTTKRPIDRPHLKKGKYWEAFEDWLKSMKDSARASFEQEFVIKLHETSTILLIMMSQSAAEVHAVCKGYWRNSFVFEVYDIIHAVMERIVKRGKYNHVPCFLDYMLGALKGIYKNETCDGALPSQHSQHAFTVAAVLHLLGFVFQYLVGYIDKGGTKTYSSGCFGFRASYVSVLLFLAAFVWIKFRQATRPSTGKRKQPEDLLDDANDSSHVFPRKYGSITKYEARYTIPVNMRDEAHPVKYPRLTLGEHELSKVAAFVWRVAETCYEDQRGTCCVTLEGKPYTFLVPAMSEQEQGLVGEVKRKWVIDYAKDVGKKEYEKYAMQLAPATGTGSHDRSQARRTCQPSLMLAHTAHEPLNGLDAPSCSVPLLPPCAETAGEDLNPGPQPFQVEHQGPAQGFEGPVSSNCFRCQWPEGPPPPNGLQTEFSHEELTTLCGALANDITFEQEIPFNSTMLYSDSALLEDDNSNIFEAGAATVEFSQLWSVQTFQQGRAAGDAVEQCADVSGSDSIVVEQSELVPTEQQNPQVFSVQSREADHLQGSEIQLAEPSQQMSDRWGEPSESIPQRYERLLKDYERLRKEKELSDEEKERLREENKRLRNAMSDAIVVLVASKATNDQLCIDHLDDDAQ